MKISDFMTSNISVIDSSWTRKHAISATSALESGYVIVRDTISSHSTVDFYLLALEEFKKKINDSRSSKIGKILNLAALDPATTWAHDFIVQATIARGIVLEGNQPIGVFEPPQSYEAPVSDAPFGGDFIEGPPVNPVSPVIAGDKSPINIAEVTRYLIGDLPSAGRLSAPITLTVQLKVKSVSGKNAAKFTLPIGTRVDIIVSAVERLRVVGPSTTFFEVQDPQPEKIVTFALAAEDVGTGCVEICAYHNGSSITTLPLTVEIVNELPDNPPSKKQEEAQLTLSRREPPDLALFIVERDNEITFYLQSADGAYTMNDFGPITLQTPRQYFQNFFGKIENLPLETPKDRKKAQERLAEKGLDLFAKAIPTDLQEVFWKMRNHVRTLQISSDEPWIPWEVCKLKGLNSAGQVEEGPFFAEAFNVTRWFRKTPSVMKLRLRKIALVVPDDSGLAKAQTEKNYILGLKGDSRTVQEITPTVSDVKEAMATGEYDAWHFTGHARADIGVNADQSAIELNDQEPLSPEQIVGNAENLLQTQPFVFLNACQTAQSGMSLTGAGGWAQRLVKVKQNYKSASVFIGTYWSVDDEKALEFAKVLYKCLLDGKSIGDAAMQARHVIKGQDDPAWLAYTIYADPSAKIM